jgi:hypothetical protein
MAQGLQQSVLLGRIAGCVEVVVGGFEIGHDHGAESVVHEELVEQDPVGFVAVDEAFVEAHTETGYSR